MKIINLNNSSSIPLTCDSTVITSDSIIITCDQTHIDTGTPYIMKIIPRFFNQEIELLLYNELTQENTSQICSTTFDGGIQTIPFGGTFFEGDSFEVTVNSLAGELIYRCKAYATNVVDLENYKLTYPNNDGVYEF